MPWTVKRDAERCSASKPWAVVKDDDDSVVGCHATEDDANAQLRALNAAEMGIDRTDMIELEIKLDPDVYSSPQFKVARSTRRLAGLVMPYGVVATDSRGMGQWRFQKGSLNWKDVGRVKLLRDHDLTQPVGRAVSLDDRQDGLYGVFQVARGAKGDEVLSLAEDGILDGFSAGPLIEPDGWQADPRDRGVRLVSNGRLVETTITAVPAYDSARVHHVAAMLRQSPNQGSGSMANKDEGKGEGSSSGEGQAITLENPQAAMQHFETQLNDRFDKLGEKVAESVGKAAEGMAETYNKVISDALAASFARLEGPTAAIDQEFAAARVKVVSEAPIYRFDSDPRGASMVRDFWRANTERDHDAVDRLRKFQEQQRDMVALLQRMPMSARAMFDVTQGNASQVIPPGYRPDLFVNELMRGRPLTAMASRGTITDATPFTVPRFVSSTGATADHVEGTNPTEASMTLDAVTVSPGAISGRFDLTREIVDASNPAIDAIALSTMREAYNRQTEQKAYAALNNQATGSLVENVTDAQLTANNEVTIGLVRSLLAKYPFTRFASPTGAAISQKVTVNFANAKDTTSRPLLPSVGATNTVGLGNAVDQGWFVDGLPFVPAWAITEAVADDVAIIVNRTDYWAWESPLLTFRFEEKQGPAIIELALFAYFATKVLRPAGIAALNRSA
jgi:HK97 family phage prohead protease/HK97 family phage major capsid protein